MDDDQFGRDVERLNRLIPQVMRILKAGTLHISEGDLTISQLHVMGLLQCGGPRTMSDLAAQLYVSLPTVTGTVDRLTRLGLVERLQDPSDRRVVRVALTERGKAMVETAHQRVRQRLASIVGRLAPEQRSALIQALEAFHQAALAELPCPQPTEDPL